MKKIGLLLVVLMLANIELGFGWQGKMPIADSLKKRGNAYLTKGPLDSAILYLDSSIIVAQLEGNLLVEAKATNNLAVAYLYKDSLEKGLILVSRSIQAYTTLQNDTLLGQAYINAGILYKKMGLINEATTYYLMGIEKLRALNNTKNLIAALNNIGNLYRNNKRIDEAVKFHKEAIEKSLAFNAYKLGQSYNNLGKDFTELLAYDSAIKYLRMALANKTDEIEKVSTYYLLGQSFRKQKKYDSAIANYRKSLAIIPPEQQNGLRADNNTGLLFAYNATNQSTQGSSIIEWFEQHNITLKTDQRINLFLAQIGFYKQTQQPLKAIKAYEALNLLRLQQLEEQNKNNTKAQEATYYFNKEKARNEQIMLEAAYLTRINRIILYLAIGLLIIALQQYILRGKNRKAKIEAQKQREEKQQLYNEMHHRVKNSFAAFASVLQLEASNQANKNTQLVLNETRQRLQSMALIHNKLYAGEDDGETLVNLSMYIKDITEEALQTLAPTPESFTINLTSVPVEMPAIRAMHLGQAVNEVITNIIKYAYRPDQTTQIFIAVKALAQENLFELCIHNSMHSTGANNPAHPPSSGLGMAIIESRSQMANTQWQLDQAQGFKHSWRFSSP